MPAVLTPVCERSVLCAMITREELDCMRKAHKVANRKRLREEARQKAAATGTAVAGASGGSTSSAHLPAHDKEPAIAAAAGDELMIRRRQRSKLKRKSISMCSSKLRLSSCPFHGPGRKRFTGQRGARWRAGQWKTAARCCTASSKMQWTGA